MVSIKEKLLQWCMIQMSWASKDPVEWRWFYLVWMKMEAGKKLNCLKIVRVFWISTKQGIWMESWNSKTNLLFGMMTANLICSIFMAVSRKLVWRIFKWFTKLIRTISLCNSEKLVKMFSHLISGTQCVLCKLLGLHCQALMGNWHVNKNWFLTICIITTDWGKFILCI